MFELLQHADFGAVVAFDGSLLDGAKKTHPGVVVARARVVHFLQEGDLGGLFEVDKRPAEAILARLIEPDESVAE